MSIRCRQCGGSMHFDIPSQSLECGYCQAKLSVGQYKENNAAVASQDAFENNVFLCPNCGAELSSLEEETTTYCSYCGSQAMLKEKQVKNKPAYIIPFKQSQEQAKTQYVNLLKNQWFVPDDLKDPDHLNEFRGIYIPHWSYFMETNKQPFAVKGIKRYTLGGYDYTDTYNVDVQIQSDIGDIAVDASDAFSDSIAVSIAPYDTKDEVSFNEAYLAGFYADKETVPPESYYDEVQKIASDKVRSKMQTSADIGELSPKPSESTLFTGRKAQLLSLLPVWFLTYRNGDRVAYSVMNGQSGKMTMDVPVDKKKFFTVVGISTAILAVVFFLLFNGITAMEMPGYAAFCSLISSFVLLSEIKYLRKRERFEAHNKEKFKKGIGGIIITCLVAFFGYGIANEINPHLGIPVLTFIVQILLAARITKNCAELDNRKASSFSLIVLALSFLTMVIVAINPVADEWHYIATMSSIGGILVNCFTSIMYFNDLTTRPVPNFFKRNGGRNNAN